ncbi:hypothetical protein APD36_10395 [Acinetobacter pittii]|nr:hypothetical protein APD36_10395 [Acinetobacter pittii]
MFEMDKFEEFYKQHCLDHFGYDPDLNWIFEKHEDGSYIQIEVENAKKVFNHQQAKVEELQRRNQMLSDSTLEMGSKHIRDTDLINQQASTLFRLREFIYGSGDLREYSDEELLEHQRILKVILTGEQALKGEG